MKKFFDRRNVFQMSDRKFRSDYFVCTSCGHSAYLKVLGDTAKCPQCGGTMRRQ